MNCRNVVTALTILITAGQVLAAEREVITVDWSRFQQQVSTRKLLPRTARVRLRGGDEVKTTLVRIEDRGLVAKQAKAIRAWASGPGEALIPKEQVSSVRFGGRSGHRGLTIGLAGVAAGAAIPLGISASKDYEEVPIGLAAVVLAPVFGTVGYLIGHALDRPAPEFIIH